MPDRQLQPEPRPVADPVTENVERRTWEEFRSAGLLWAANTVLHWLGWAIVVVTDDHDKIIDVYPARTRLRGFGAESNERGITALTDWMAKAAGSLRKEIDE